MDWKVRIKHCRRPWRRGTEILHFRHAFHGRTGYTMSPPETNTDPRKTDLFAKFNWPRVQIRRSIFFCPKTNAKPP